MVDPFIIMCAPNGARRNKGDHPRLPISPDELGECSEEILAAGASIIHLHVRDEDGNHTLDTDRYRKAIAAIRERVGEKLVIQVTSEAVGRYSRYEQMAMIKDLKPEAVSIALREICPNDNDQEETVDFFNWMTAEKISPQIILYNKNDVDRFEKLQQLGLLTAQVFFLLAVLGRYSNDIASSQEDHDALLAKVAALHSPWAACAFGQQENTLAAKTANIGGHVRVGFENNLWRFDGSLVASNSELVRGAFQAAKDAGREVANASYVRKVFM